MKAIPKAYMDINWVKNAVDQRKLSQVIAALESTGTQAEVKRAAEKRLDVLSAGASDGNRAKAREERELGNNLVKDGKYEEAMPHYERSAQLDPQEATTYNNMALIYLRRQDYKNALENADRALTLKRDFMRAYQRRAEAYYGLKQYRKAYTSVLTILLEAPENSPVPPSLQRRPLTSPRPSSRPPPLSISPSTISSLAKRPRRSETAPSSTTSPRRPRSRRQSRCRTSLTEPRSRRSRPRP